MKICKENISFTDSGNKRYTVAFTIIRNLNFTDFNSFLEKLFLNFNKIIFILFSVEMGFITEHRLILVYRNYF